MIFLDALCLIICSLLLAFSFQLLVWTVTSETSTVSEVLLSLACFAICAMGVYSGIVHMDRCDRPQHKEEIRGECY